jgi:hypothetical protein
MQEVQMLGDKRSNQMIAYEFSTAVTDDGVLVIPEAYAKTLSTGESVRVILLVKENGYHNDHREEPTDKPSSLEDLVAEIKRMPPNPANIKPASGLLGEKLANPVTDPDPDFDLEEWTREWDRLEAEMKAQSLAHEAAELRELWQ